MTKSYSEAKTKVNLRARSGRNKAKGKSGRGKVWEQEWYSRIPDRLSIPARTADISSARVRRGSIARSAVSNAQRPNLLGQEPSALAGIRSAGDGRGQRGGKQGGVRNSDV